MTSFFEKVYKYRLVELCLQLNSQSNLFIRFGSKYLVYLFTKLSRQETA